MCVATISPQLECIQSYLVMCCIYFAMSENDVPVMLLEVVAFYLAKTKCDLKCGDYGVNMALHAWL